MLDMIPWWAMVTYTCGTQEQMFPDIMTVFCMTFGILLPAAFAPLYRMSDRGHWIHGSERGNFLEGQTHESVDRDTYVCSRPNHLCGYLWTRVLLQFFDITLGTYTSQRTWLVVVGLCIQAWVCCWGCKRRWLKLQWAPLTIYVWSLDICA